MVQIQQKFFCKDALSHLFLTVVNTVGKKEKDYVLLSDLN